MGIPLLGWKGWVALGLRSLAWKPMAEENCSLLQLRFELPIMGHWVSWSCYLFWETDGIDQQVVHGYSLHKKEDPLCIWRDHFSGFPCRCRISMLIDSYVVVNVILPTHICHATPGHGMDVWIAVHISTELEKPICAFIHVYIHIYTTICILFYTHIHIHLGGHTYVYRHRYSWIHMDTCIHIYIYIYVHIYMYRLYKITYRYIHRNRDIA